VEDATDPDGPPPWRRLLGPLDRLLLSILMLAPVADWALWRARFPTEWDSALFTLAVDRYDLRFAQPHAPGYPLYVAAGKVAAWVVGDSHGGLVLVALLASMAAVAGAYLLVRHWASPPFAALSAVALLAAPLFLYHTLVALSYSAEAAAATWLTVAAWRARSQATTVRLAALGAGFAIAVGLRTSSLFTLAPLVAWAVLGRPRPGGVLALRAALVALAAALVAALWLAPVVVLAGGVGPYAAILGWQSAHFVFPRTVLQAGPAVALENAAALLGDLAPEALLAAATAVLAAWGLRGRATGSASPAALLAAWAVPPALFGVLVFSGWPLRSSGFALALLAPLAALFGWTASRAWPGPGRMRAVALALLFAVPVAASALAGPGPVAAVRDRDSWSASWSGLADAFPPDQTAVLASGSWAPLKWLLPDFLLFGQLGTPLWKGTDGHDGTWVLAVETRNRTDSPAYYDGVLAGPSAQPRHGVPGWVRHIVVADSDIEERGLRPDVALRHALLPDGRSVAYFDTDGRRFLDEYVQWR
jgi:hypothetical protein